VSTIHLANGESLYVSGEAAEVTAMKILAEAPKWTALKTDNGPAWVNPAQVAAVTDD
jgi:hypothetical protein